MRLIVNGQQAFGKESLEAILEADKDEVVAVYTAPDQEGRPVDPIKQSAMDHGIPVFQPTDYKSAQVLDQMESLNSDLMVMAFMIIFMPEQARNIPTHGSICFHPSLLPRHRGPSSINWPIIQGAARTGLTIFWPDDGLDEGDVLLQKEVTIEPDDTLGSVYFKKIFPLGIQSVLEAIDLVRAGNPPRIQQNESDASYESWCRKKDARIDWDKPLDEVYNLIRGTNPQPGAWTTFNGAELQIFDCQKVIGIKGLGGEVMEVNEGSFTVAAAHGGICVHRVRPAGGGKIGGGEFAAQGGLVVGSILVS